MRLAEGVQLHTAFLCARYRKDGKRTGAEDETVRVVVAYHYPVPTAEIHQLTVEIHGGRGPGRHVGIIGPHHLDTCKVHALQRIEVRLPPFTGKEVVFYYIGLHQRRCGRICRITRIRDQHLVPSVQKSKRQEKDPLLGAHKRLNLTGRVELHAIIPPVPCGKRSPQFRDADIALVGMVAGPGRGLHQGLYCRCRRHPVRRTYPQIDDTVLSRGCPGGIEGIYFLEFGGKVVFFHCLRPFCWSYNHGSNVFPV